jgi:hypothetical protein
MARWARAISHGWVVTGAVPGPDVDEFAEVSAVVAALAAAGGADTLLAIQHPHRTPRARAEGLSVMDALPPARRALDRLRARAYHEVADVVAAYRVGGSDGLAVGVLCLVDPAAVDRRGMSWVRHSEEVYPWLVDERAAVLTGLGCATSAAMLVPVHGGGQLTAAVLRCIATRGQVAASSADAHGRVHQLWLLGPGPEQQALLAAVMRAPLLVADGNHRVAAAATSGSHLLAFVTAGPCLRVGAFYRALVGTGLTAGELADAWCGKGLLVQQVCDPDPPQLPGTVTVRTGEAGLVVELPPPGPAEPRPRIDHGVVERLLIADALGIDPGGPHVRALPAGHLVGPDLDALLQLAPVPFADVLAVHRQGRRMPRKSTYFTPKPRSGLLLADLTR